jgi:hypothetical protein
MEGTAVKLVEVSNVRQEPLGSHTSQPELDPNMQGKALELRTKHALGIRRFADATLGCLRQSSEQAARWNTDKNVPDTPRFEYLTDGRYMCSHTAVWTSLYRIRNFGHPLYNIS